MSLKDHDFVNNMILYYKSLINEITDIEINPFSIFGKKLFLSNDN